MDDSVYINLGTPKYGWLPVDFYYDGLKLDMEVSDGLNDPIGELCDTLIGLDHDKIVEVTWWLEPAAYYFNFEKKGTDYILIISQADDLNEDNRKVIKIISGNYKQIIAPLKKALIEFCSKTYEAEHWPYTLDKNKLKLLSADT